MKTANTPLRSGTILVLAAAATVIGACGGADATPERASTVPAAERAAPPEPEGPPPNLVLVLIDTLRLARLGLDGEAPRAPFLAGLAARSVRFPRAQSTSSWTAPATASVFTGLYPTRHGVHQGLWANRKDARRVERGELGHLEVRSLPASVATLPERLRERGYATFGAAGNVNVGGRLGFDRGFEHFFHDRKASAELLTATVAGWREELAAAAALGRPWFVYLHLNDAHMPYEGHEPWYVPQEGEAEDELARYDSELRYLDGALEGLFGELEWERDAIVIVVSDHGEEFGDHGGHGHTFSLHAELTDVLFLVHEPGVAPARIDARVSLVDVLPTLLDYAGAPAAEVAEGRSLVPDVRAGTPAGAEGERPVFSHRTKESRPDALWSVALGPWKLIEHDEDGTRELYDVEADPGETRDASGARPDVVARLVERLQAFRATSLPLEEDAPAVEVDMDSELLEHLRSLGYAGEDEGG